MRDLPTGTVTFGFTDVEARRSCWMRDDPSIQLEVARRKRPQVRRETRLFARAKYGLSMLSRFYARDGRDDAAVTKDVLDRAADAGVGT